jgi:hypothetical protein
MAMHLAEPNTFWETKDVEVISTEDLHPRVHRMHTRTTKAVLHELERGYRDAIRYG